MVALLSRQMATRTAHQKLLQNRLDRLSGRANGDSRRLVSNLHSVSLTEAGRRRLK
jgi:hypothetical protein